MNKQKQRELVGLLTDLTSTQDTITRAQARERRNLKMEQELITIRDNIKNEILSFVESLTEK